MNHISAFTQATRFYSLGQWQNTQHFCLVMAHNLMIYNVSINKQQVLTPSNVERKGGFVSIWVINGIIIPI